jgi:hypothetical protein
MAGWLTLTGWLTCETWPANGETLLHVRFANVLLRRHMRRCPPAADEKQMGGCERLAAADKEGETASKSRGGGPTTNYTKQGMWVGRLRG